jgi:anti-anti-sigma regulatory factor
VLQPVSCPPATGPANDRKKQEKRRKAAMEEAGEGIGDCVVLPAVADLTQAGPLKQKLELALASGNGLSVDASAVQRISSPCLQVLVAGVSSFAKAGGAALVIENPSEAFRETISVLGLSNALRLGK